MANELNSIKPCPFCGGTSVSVMFNEMSARVLCAECNTLGPEACPKQTFENAVKVWNQRLGKVKTH
jgi:Lar family restriction alleviation protein